MKKKAKIIIGIVLSVMVLIGLGISCYFFFQYKELKKPIKENWGQKYYMYLKDVNENKKQKKAGLPKNLKKSELTFYEVDSVKDPIMVINYETDKHSYSNVYYISNNKVNVLVYSQPTTVELLYNIENKKYDYYSHTISDNKDKYKTIAEQISERIKELEKGKQNSSSNNQKVEEETEYVFSDDTVDKVVDINGKELIINKFDETFVKPEIESDTINYNDGLKEKDLKAKIVEQINDYKSLKDVVTKEMQKQVEKKVEEVEKVQEEMATAKEEVEKKEAEEKAKKEAEEKEKALKEGLKVGAHTLKYGTYTTSVPNGGMDGNDLFGTITLKPNGAFHIKTNFEQSSGEAKKVDEDGTYTTGTEMNSYDLQDAIFFKTNSGYKFSFFVTNNTYFNSQWIMYNYSGN